jgi:hypothetical protein
MIAVACDFIMIFNLTKSFCSKEENYKYLKENI